MYLGIDLGTSAVKALLVDDEQRVVGISTRPLAVAGDAPGHREQDPEHWWLAVVATVDELHAAHPVALAAVRGIGLCGQMHGAVLLDGVGQVLRPAILWNDTRAVAECGELEHGFSRLRSVTGNVAMPGFTAPKLLWVRRHEPAVFGRIRKVLLPKAYIRFRMTGETIEDMSDASGSLWLEVGRRDWSDEALAATGLDRSAMPSLVEGSAIAGVLGGDLVRRWGMTRAPVLAGGAGDNAAGAVGLGATRAGGAFLSLGTSGVLWVTTDRFRPYPQAAVHAFCHAVPDTWHQMGVTLSAAASLAWWAGVSGRSELALLEEMGTPGTPSPALFLPYLSGERTPHNDGAIRGAFAGLSQEDSRPALTQAVLEGVAFSMRDCLDALRASGSTIDGADVIGGGSRSRAWVRILAAALDIPLHRVADGEHGGAFGAARLGRLAATGEAVADVCLPPARVETIEPDPALSAAYADRLPRYHALGAAVKAALHMTSEEHAR